MFTASTPSPAPMNKAGIFALLAISSLTFAACVQDTSPLAPLPRNVNRPLGVEQDFAAVFETRDGQFVSTTEVAQSGNAVVLHKTSSVSDIRCDNLEGTFQCRTATGALMPAGDTDTLLRIESTTAMRLVGRQRLLAETVPFERQNPPSNMPLFNESNVSTWLQPYIGQLPDTTLESCFRRELEEETELFCFGGELMPYWVSSTATGLGTITTARFLKAYAPVSLTTQQLQEMKAAL